jgi:hypothetical protein
LFGSPFRDCFVYFASFNVKLFIYFAFQIDWKREQSCFEGISLELANLYSHDPSMYWVQKSRAKPLNASTSSAAAASSDDPLVTSLQSAEGLLPEKELDIWAQHFLSPAIRTFLSVTKELRDVGAIVPVASLENLYKIFERC